MSHSRPLPFNRPISSLAYDRPPSSASTLSSLQSYRLQTHSKGNYPPSLSSSEAYSQPSERRRGSGSPLLKLRGEFEGFYRKATGSRPTSPRNALVNNATFEPLILRTKAEAKVAAERAERKPEIVTKLPQTIRLEDLIQAVELLESSSSSDCGQLSRQYAAELLRLSQAITTKLSK